MYLLSTMPLNLMEMHKICGKNTAVHQIDSINSRENHESSVWVYKDMVSSSYSDEEHNLEKFSK